jgi:hypothetical protein
MAHFGRGVGRCRRRLLSKERPQHRYSAKLPLLCLDVYKLGKSGRRYADRDERLTARQLWKVYWQRVTHPRDVRPSLIGSNVQARPSVRPSCVDVVACQSPHPPRPVLGPITCRRVVVGATLSTASGWRIRLLRQRSQRAQKSLATIPLLDAPLSIVPPAACAQTRRLTAVLHCPLALASARGDRGLICSPASERRTRRASRQS